MHTYPVLCVHDLSCNLLVADTDWLFDSSHLTWTEHYSCLQPAEAPGKRQVLLIYMQLPLQLHGRKMHRSLTELLAQCQLHSQGQQ